MVNVEKCKWQTLSAPHEATKLKVLEICFATCLQGWHFSRTRQECNFDYIQHVIIYTTNYLLAVPLWEKAALQSR